MENGLTLQQCLKHGLICREDSRHDVISTPESQFSHLGIIKQSA